MFLLTGSCLTSQYASESTYCLDLHTIVLAVQLLYIISITRTKNGLRGIYFFFCLALTHLQPGIFLSAQWYVLPGVSRLSAACCWGCWCWWLCVYDPGVVHGGHGKF